MSDVTVQVPGFDDNNPCYPVSVFDCGTLHAAYPGVTILRLEVQRTLLDHIRTWPNLDLISVSFTVRGEPADLIRHRFMHPDWTALPPCGVRHYDTSNFGRAQVRRVKGGEYRLSNLHLDHDLDLLAPAEQDACRLTGREPILPNQGRLRAAFLSPSLIVAAGRSLRSTRRRNGGDVVSGAGRYLEMHIVVTLVYPHPMAASERVAFPDLMHRLGDQFNAAIAPSIEASPSSVIVHLDPNGYRSRRRRDIHLRMRPRSRSDSIWRPTRAASNPRALAISGTVTDVRPRARIACKC
jgi:hypothetical protein